MPGEEGPSHTTANSKAVTPDSAHRRAATAQFDAGRRYLVRMVATRGNRLRTISVAAGNVGDDGTLADVVAILKGEWEDR